MKILFSYPTELANEVSLINEEMISGKWKILHLRKPDWTENEVMDLYKNLSDEVKQKTVLHQSGKQSCHTFEEVESIDGKAEYCFLSPIYDSISKEGYQSNFEKTELKEFLKKERKTKVIALGGVSDKNYNEVIELGFDGGAFLGSVWKKYD